MTKLIATVIVRTLCQEILQQKNPLNHRAIERILRVEGGGDGSGVGASGSGSSQRARSSRTRATVVDLARTVDEK